MYIFPICIVCQTLLKDFQDKFLQLFFYKRKKETKARSRRADDSEKEEEKEIENQN